MPQDEQHSHELGSSSKASQKGLPDPSASDKSRALQSLAPKYNQEHHEIYVKHLQRAVEDDRNRNIALTGHYGTGKSSILDKFLELQEGDSINAIRISISTLGSASDEDLNNQLQKELVKQLIYRSSPGEVKTSRFARTKEFKPSAALKDAIIPSALICSFFWLFDAFPHASSLAQVSAYLPILTLFALITGSVWWGRWVIGNKFISTLSAAGTSISFSSETKSYFDEYLEEIITYFEATGVDLVVFEDIDRFDEPRIFDSLRELNTLINAATAWKRDKPIRFIYAIKDSLFEAISSPESAGSSDAAHNANPRRFPDRIEAGQRELIRANRTKFFDLIVPVVPFLALTNSRDHLALLVSRLNLPEDTIVSRNLINLVGQHVTDMRLMQNICNEFVVFAEKLLWVDKDRQTPGVSADSLFAIVVYKNFHLGDFEKIAQRRSQLDRLEQFRKSIVAESIRNLEKIKSDAQKILASIDRHASVAPAKSEKFWTAIEAARIPLVAIIIDERKYVRTSTRDVYFWMSLKHSSDVIFQLQHEPTSTPQEWTLDNVKSRAPDAIDEDWLSTLPPCDSAADVSMLSHEISDLRGASYQFLLEHKEYGGDEGCFEKRLEECLSSKLSRELVKQGFLDRYYAEYSSIFHGAFLGIEVANFFRNCVWPNETDIYARFTTTTALDNILEQAPPDFTQTRSVLNLDIVDYLVANRENEAKDVARFIAQSDDEDTQAFLTAYLNEASHERFKFVRLLAKIPWSNLLTFLTNSAHMNDEADAINLFDAALLAAHLPIDFEVDDDVSKFFDAHYGDMSAMTGRLTPTQEKVVWGFIKKIRFSASDLTPVAEPLKHRLIEADMYSFSISNLRVVLGLEKHEFPNLDLILNVDSLYDRAIKNIDVYLEEALEDYPAEFVVFAPDILRVLLEDGGHDLDTETVKLLLKQSSPSSRIEDLTEVVETSWPILAESRRFTPSAANLAEYVSKYDLDEVLSKLLIQDSGEPIAVTEIDAGVKMDVEKIRSLAVTILNANEHLTLDQRVSLVTQIKDQAGIDYLPPDKITVFDDDLLSVCLKKRIVADSGETFEHFLRLGWEAIGTAFKTSDNASSFITPKLLDRYADQFLHDDLVPDELKRIVISDLNSYFPNKVGNEEPLARAAKLARELHTEMDLAAIEWAATLQVDPEDILWQLRRLIASGQEPLAIEVMQILASLEREWLGFGEASGYEFSVNRSDSLNHVLKYLAKRNLVQLPRGGPKGTKKVKIV